MKNYFLLMIAATLLFSMSAKSQEKWTVEFRPGLNFPTNDPGDVNTKIGFGYEFTGAYKVMPHLAVYGGWGWNQFKGKDNYSSENFTFEESGFTAGLQMVRKIGTSAFSYLARAGAVYNILRLENDAGNFSAKTNRGLGWQIEAGIDYQFTYNLSLRPMIRYRSLATEFDISNFSADLKLNYISFGVGLAWDFNL